VSVTVLCPGPTETNFGTVARGGKARVMQTKKMSAEAVARYGHFAFRHKQVIAVPGFQNRAMVFLTRLLPRRTVRRMVNSYNKFRDEDI